MWDAWTAGWKLDSLEFRGSCFCRSQQWSSPSSPPLSKTLAKMRGLSFQMNRLGVWKRGLLINPFLLTAWPPFPLLIPRSISPKWILHLFHFPLWAFSRCQPQPKCSTAHMIVLPGFRSLRCCSCSFFFFLFLVFTEWGDLEVFSFFSCMSSDKPARSRRSGFQQNKEQ